MNTKTIVAIAAILVLLGAGYAVARQESGFWNGMMGYGNGNAPGAGMMGGNGGMMNANGGYGGMMGNGNGMMGGSGFGTGMMGSGMMSNAGYGIISGQGDATAACATMMGYTGDVNANPLTIEKAKEAVEQYLASTGNADLKLSEVMEFDNHFYAEVEEKSTGVHAFELLVNRYTGAVVPEMGPNMMWNAKYSPMAAMTGFGNVQAQATVTGKQAIEYARQYLDRALPGTKADEADAFYGYYTVHVVKDGNIYGMLSVNSNTGAIWYHNWHGAFVKILEVE